MHRCSVRMAELAAFFYLDEWGHELSREAFAECIEDGYSGLLIHAGGGYVPLSAAVLTFGRDKSSAFSAFEEWARRTGRLDEIGEEDPDDECFGEYEATCECIGKG
jgi:hypothetical protein